jgi:hypothetical protein
MAYIDDGREVTVCPDADSNRALIVASGVDAELRRVRGGGRSWRLLGFLA